MMASLPIARQAVIDIGSNSVRLVVYGGPKRAPISLFNEKMLCGLGRRDRETGHLTETAMSSALSILGRFKAVLKELGDPPVKVIATAAMREAPNGKDFIADIKALGFSPTVLSGEEEGRLSALGVLSGAPEILANRGSSRSHLCGDMGGGSLELVRYGEDEEAPIKNIQSFPLGPLRLIADFGPKVRDAEKPVAKMLAACDWLTDEKTQELHAVGGAWRAFARIHQAIHDYPLKMLHHYVIEKQSALETCKLVEKQSAEGLANIPGVQSRRIETLPHAVLVLRKVIELTKAKSVVISSFGIREGVLFDELSQVERREDPLLAIASEYAARFNPNPKIGDKLFEFLGPLFPSETAAEARLRKAACLLTDIAALYHPDMRAEQGCNAMLSAPLVGLTHPERILLAAALYYRYRGKPVDLPAQLPPALLAEEEVLWAKQVGFALRFAADLSPKSGHIYSGSQFTLVEDEIHLTVPEAAEALFSDTVMRRLMVLSEILDKRVLIQNGHIKGQ